MKILKEMLANYRQQQYDQGPGSPWAKPWDASTEVGRHMLERERAQQALPRKSLSEKLADARQAWDHRESEAKTRNAEMSHRVEAMRHATTLEELNSYADIFENKYNVKIKP